MPNLASKQCTKLFSCKVRLGPLLLTVLLKKKAGWSSLQKFLPGFFKKPQKFSTRKPFGVLQKDFLDCFQNTLRYSKRKQNKFYTSIKNSDLSRDFLHFYEITFLYSIRRTSLQVFHKQTLWPSMLRLLVLNEKTFCSSM